MADLKTVIYDIERCICHVPDACKDCSKYGGDNAIGCMEELLEDALELLKAQEPRLMTLEEVKELNWDYCYLEEEVAKDKTLRAYIGKHRVKCVTWPSIATCTLTYGDDSYGKRWRCWTEKPTEEQREAMPWDEPPKEET